MTAVLVVVMFAVMFLGPCVMASWIGRDEGERG